MRRLSKTLAAVLAMTPMVASATAHAAAPCITSEEFGSLAQFAMPSIVEGARQRCLNTLPATAFLRTGAAAMEQRYRQGSAQAWPRAKAAFLKIGNTGKDTDLLFAAMPDSGLQSTIDTVVQGLVVSQLPPDQCATVDRLLADLAPLPARNTADLIALLVTVGSEKKGHAGPINICPR